MVVQQAERLSDVRRASLGLPRDQSSMVTLPSSSVYRL
jgi:hypothetical protein